MEVYLGCGWRLYNILIWQCMRFWRLYKVSVSFHVNLCLSFIPEHIPLVPSWTAGVLEPAETWECEEHKYTSAYKPHSVHSCVPLNSFKKGCQLNMLCGFLCVSRLTWLMCFTGNLKHTHSWFTDVIWLIYFCLSSSSSSSSFSSISSSPPLSLPLSLFPPRMSSLWWPTSPRCWSGGGSHLCPRCPPPSQTCWETPPVAWALWTPPTPQRLRSPVGCLTCQSSAPSNPGSPSLSSIVLK